jgi:hypothetical protein
MNAASATASKPASTVLALLGLSMVQPRQAAAPAWSQIKNRDEALRALWCAADRDPRENPIGIVIESALIRPGKTICWFESWADLNDAIKDFLVPLAFLNPCDTVRLRRRLTRMHRPDQRPGLKALEKLLAPELRVHWIGTFQEMRAAQGDFARAAVSDFLQIRLAADSAEIEVPSCDLERFVIWLRQGARTEFAQLGGWIL